MDADEALARALQAQWDAEAADSEPSASHATPSLIQNRPTLNVSKISPNRSDDLLQYVKEICAIPCSGCRRKLITSAQNVEVLFHRWYKEPVSSIVKCTHCKAHTCSGCGKSVNSVQAVANKTEAAGTTLCWCCDSGRLFVIWVLAWGFDKSLTVEDSRVEQASKGKRRVHDGSNGVGYGGSFNFGGPYSRNRMSARFGATENEAKHDKDRAAQHLVDEDSLIDDVLVLINKLLPIPGGSQDFDRTPPPVLRSILAGSEIPRKISELLCNDSLEDINKRVTAYCSVLDFVRSVVSSKVLSPVVLDERLQRAKGESLLSVSFGPMSITGKTREDSTACSVAACLRDLHIQAETLLKQVSKAKGSMQDMKPFLELCRHVIEVANLVQSKAPQLAQKIQGWKEWQKERCILAVSQAEVERCHYHLDYKLNFTEPDMRVKLHNISSPGRTKRVMMEIANMKTSLPPGIFVRYCDARLDVMKCMIIGPADTPYENGVITFELWCPPNYPNVSPRVNCATSRRHYLGYNPNLYNNGKVCLSLLGTWAGEQWRPGQSTILQVLLSIQALILCVDPIANEPAFEGFAKTPQSMSYNLDTMLMTMKHAMLSWLETTSEEPIWQEIAHKHFKQNAAQIIKNVQKWTVEAGRQSQSSGSGFGSRGRTGVASLTEYPSIEARLRAALERISGQKFEAPHAVSQRYGSANTMYPNAGGGFYAGGQYRY